MAVWDWSTTAANNATADSNINWAENQAPSTVNDSARAEMARIAYYLNWQAANVTNGGASNAYTYTSGETLSAYADNMRFAWSPNADSTGAVTLNVDSIGAKKVYMPDGAQANTGDLDADSIYDVIYDSSLDSAAGGFKIVGFPDAVTSGALIATNNLSDLDNASTARSNLGLGDMATASYSDTQTFTGTVSVNTSGSNASFSGADELSLRNTSGDVGMTFWSAATGRALICFADPTGGNVNNRLEVYSDTHASQANDWVFISDGAEFMRWDKSSSQVEITGGLTTTGDVGIGTTSPDRLAHLSASGAAYLRLENTTAGLAANDYLGIIEFEKVDGSGGGAGVAASIGAQTTDLGGAIDLVFSVGSASGNNAEAMRIDSDGNVGIGTSSPEGRAHVREDVAGNNDALIVHNRNASGEASISLIGGAIDYSDDRMARISSGSSGSYLAIDLSNGAAPVEVARFIPSGLDVADTLLVGAGDAVTMRSWDSGDTDIDGLIPGTAHGGLIEGRLNGHLTLGIKGNDSLDGVQIISGGGNYSTDSTYDTLIAHFGANGNVGIGTTSPNATFHVEGNTQTRAPVVTTSGTLVQATHLEGHVINMNGNVTLPTAATGCHVVLIAAGGARTITRGSGLALYVNGTNTASVSLADRKAVSVVYTSGSSAYLTGDVT